MDRAVKSTISTTTSTFHQQSDCVWCTEKLPKYGMSTQLRLCKKISELSSSSQTTVKSSPRVSSTSVREVSKQAIEEVKVRSISDTDRTVAASSSGRQMPFRHFPTLSVQAVVTVVRKLKSFLPTPHEDILEAMDAVADQVGLSSILLQIVSEEVDPRQEDLMVDIYAIAKYGWERGPTRDAAEGLRACFHLDDIIGCLNNLRARHGTGTGKLSHVSKLRGWSEKASVKADKVQYTVDFELAADFGTPGAIAVHNKHQSEFFLDSVTLRYSWRSISIHFPCQSWLQPSRLSSEERIFFSNKVYLPSETPAGLRELRKKELEALRGDGKGEREHHERVYDYAVYNDLGDPDRVRLARPILGGSDDFPYPRRCRTGRQATKSDPTYESRTAVGGKIYVPRDETFASIKEATFSDSCMNGFLHRMAPKVWKTLTETNEVQGSPFCSFKEIDKLYRSVKTVTTLPNERQRATDVAEDIFSAAGLGFLKGLRDFLQLPFIGNPTSHGLDFNYPVPELVSRDRFAWIRDEEFARQMLAGQNPCVLECLKVFPPVSELDPALYGPQKSAIRADHLKYQLDGLTVEQAIEQKKIFIVDYHDLFMPFLDAINKMEGRKSYASRTVLYLTRDGVLRPVAIELSLPRGPDGFPGSQRVFTPGDEHTKYWLWTLAKAHVCCNDAGHHQLVSHWLRTHAATEPYVIATHRHLSVMHPIANLLKPHLRYTMEINSAARQNLVCADGVIDHNLDSSHADPVTKMMFKIIGTLSLEYCFTPGRHCMEMSSTAYKKLWRFDKEALPADLISRGMAEEDETSPHGLKLTIEDYPFAADGLLLWSAIESWVTDYVCLHYKDPSTIINDIELQAWWTEIILVGHADKKHEPWWPKLDTNMDLIHILTTMIWITSGYHAAVNFGQFAYSGYVPNRPCLTKRLIPEEHEPEYQEFVQDPETFFLSTIPNQEEATAMMMIIEALSAHSPDEEYLGQRRPHWTNDKNALNLFEKFTSSMMSAEKEIELRNRNPGNKNRSGAGVPPYELLFPRSGPGLTGRGVPNSVSI